MRKSGNWLKFIHREWKSSNCIMWRQVTQLAIEKSMIENNWTSTWLQKWEIGHYHVVVRLISRFSSVGSIDKQKRIPIRTLKRGR